MTNVRRYCRGCSQEFDVSAEQRECEICGQALIASLLEPTVEASTAGRAKTPMSADQEQELVGSRFDKYRIERFLGKGGMALVYLARDLALERDCAVKVLRPDEIDKGEEAIASFLAEARSAAALVHPHVVTIHTIGEVAGRHFIEMEYIDGASLSHIVHRSGSLEPIDATRLMLQISSALAQAHGMGMIHRDIKPGNVMLTSNRDAKLADFGLAKRLDPTKVARRLLAGTPSYMAPELFRGQRASRQSDVYAMGVTYHALLTGELPVSTNSLTELMRFHAEGQPPDIRSVRNDLADEICEVVQTCLASDPAARYRDAEALHQALRAAFGQLRSLSSLAREALAQEPVTIDESSPLLTVRVALPDSRFQTVYMQIVQGAGSFDQLVRIFSVAGIARSDDFRHALEMNSVISHGAIAIEEINGQPHFVIVDTYPRATCDPEEVRRSVMSIALHADEIERELSGEDIH